MPDETEKMTGLTPVILPSGEALSYGLYPNPDRHRGQPDGERGTADIGDRRLTAIRSSNGTIWCPIGHSGDWFALMSYLSTDTYRPTSRREGGPDV